MPLTFTLTFTVARRGAEDRLALADIAAYLLAGGEPGNPYDALSIIDDYARNVPVAVRIERDGEAAEFVVEGS